MNLSIPTQMKTKLFAFTLLCSLTAGCGTMKNLTQPFVRTEKVEQVVTTLPAQTNHVGDDEQITIFAMRADAKRECQDGGLHPS